MHVVKIGMELKTYGRKSKRKSKEMLEGGF
jgi:hypothetical protein